jgi:tetratricopeptide (TPR) repeat protein
VALNAKDSEAAAREFQAAIALDPGNAEAQVKLGVIAFAQGDCAAASQYLRKALAIRPGVAQVQGLLGICERRQGDSSAKALLESSFSKLADAKMTTQVGMELVALYHQRGEAERAIPVAQKLVNLNPESADILYMAQRLYRDLADDTLNKLALLAPGSARMQQVIAERLVNGDDLKGAIEHYRKALEIDPRLPGVHYELAEAVFESGSSDPSVQAEAEKELALALSIDGDSVRVQCELGKIALLRSNFELARIHYARAFAIDPNDTEAQLGLGRVLTTMEKVEEARKYLEMAVQSDPLNGGAHYRLALAYRRLRMPDEAQKQMHLFQEIKQAKEEVRKLYRQMNTAVETKADELAEDAP